MHLIEIHSVQPVTPVDTIGKGGTFPAGFLAAWLRGDKLEDAQLSVIAPRYSPDRTLWRNGDVS